MSTTNTDKNWYWYIRRKNERYYLGLVDHNGAAPTGAYTIDIYYDEIADEYTSDDDSFNIPSQFEMGIIKGVTADLMAMGGGRVDKQLMVMYRRDYEQAVYDAIHYRANTAEQPLVMKPLDLRDDKLGNSR